MEFNLAFPQYFWILFAVAALISSIGFYKFIYFISIGYGFAITGLGLIMIFLYRDSITLLGALQCALLILYGCRLGGYLLKREIKSPSYKKHMENEVKSGEDMTLGAKLSIWITCALLYVLQVSPIFYRLSAGTKDDILSYIGLAVMAFGLAFEALSDYQKSKAKKKNPKRFCDVGLFKVVRCPNYLGEVIFWTGVLITGAASLQGVMQWICALIGYFAIVYIMFGGARRLELRQNKNYGDDREYQEYVRKTPILLPLIPLHSVADWEWLKG
ncbi:DUF1295 domain-containing protein [Alloiococcus sp. CFN-8]|uniref:DUF1295 domain-containing protein n=1 Tax=Alloiococcus sp. CFN-8 TaxID=3416081 RepID=UPI003CF8CA83